MWIFMEQALKLVAQMIFAFAPFIRPDILKN